MTGPCPQFFSMRQASPLNVAAHLDHQHRSSLNSLVRRIRWLPSGRPHNNCIRRWEKVLAPLINFTQWARYPQSFWSWRFVALVLCAKKSNSRCRHYILSSWRYNFIVDESRIIPKNLIQWAGELHFFHATINLRECRSQLYNGTLLKWFFDDYIIIKVRKNILKTSALHTAHYKVAYSLEDEGSAAYAEAQASVQ